MAKEKKQDWDADPRQATWPLDWGHMAKTPYAKSAVLAVIALPLDLAQREELVAVWNRRIRVFGKAAFEQLSPGLQARLRQLAAKGVGRSTRKRGPNGELLS